MLTRAILALDLSLRGAGFVSYPLDWDGKDWDAIPRKTYGEKLSKEATPQMKVGRLVRIAKEVLAFAEIFQPVEAFVEHYAFNSHPNLELGEIGGVVKHQLTTQRGLVPTPVVASSARKVLMGTVPRQGAKDATRAYLKKIGMPASWTDDEADAFVIANYAASSLGGFAFVAEPIAPAKRRRVAA
jgi:Holliday junction resolvasome RuvABC endonuclease subunit